MIYVTKATDLVIRVEQVIINAKQAKSTFHYHDVKKMKRFMHPDGKEVDELPKEGWRQMTSKEIRWMNKHYLPKLKPGGRLITDLREI